MDLTLINPFTGVKSEERGRAILSELGQPALGHCATLRVLVCHAFWRVSHTKSRWLF